MKKLVAFVVLCLSTSIPSFGAEHIVGHSAEVAGKQSYKVAKVSVKESAHAGRAVLKTVF